MMAIKVLSVVGARPQFIKAAAVSRAITSADDVEEIMVHTGQHFDRDMSDIFFEELEMCPPSYNLGIQGGSHGQMTGRMLEKMEEVITEEKPDCVLVYGDTNTTLAGALAASKLAINLAHVEAGLRSYNRNMPEEINRKLTDHISDLLFCPTRTAVHNLKREGIEDGVHHVGDVMYDATLFAGAVARKRSDIVERLQLTSGQYALATIHRAENTDTKENLCSILDWLRNEAKSIQIVLPLHPRTREAVKTFNLSLDGIHACDPIGYLDMVRLLDGASEVYTDSGGLQKEAYFHRTPCVTLRNETEWTETIECGWNRLWYKDQYLQRKEITEYGDGNASAKIISIIKTSVK